QGEAQVVAAILDNAKDQLQTNNVVEAFNAAAQNNHGSVVGIILAQAQDKITDDATIQDAFKTSAGEGRTSVVKAILENDEAKDKLAMDMIREAINVAGGKGHAETVDTIFNKITLTQDLTVDWFTNRVSVLDDAAKKNQVEVIKTVLNNGNVQGAIRSLSQNDQQGSIIQYIMIDAGGNVDIVRAMLDIQIVKEIVQKSGLEWVVRDVFKAAAGVTEGIRGDHDNLGGGHAEVVKLLFSKFKNILDEATIKSALEAAVEKNYAAVVTAILSQEDARGKLDRTTVKVALDNAVKKAKDEGEAKREVIKAILENSNKILIKEDIDVAIGIANTNGDTKTKELLNGYRENFPAAQL
ncbi:MAG: hypothetical protein MI674_07025, partial [Cytophagales bacterium]|nr:hypothetical protein [Cytophagales bacterium]